MVHALVSVCLSNVWKKIVSVCTGLSSAVNLQCFADAQLVMLQAQQARCRLRTLVELQS